MFGGCSTIYVVYILVLHLTHPCSASPGITAANRQHVTLEITFTTETTLSNDREIVEVTEDYTTTNSFPVSKKPSFDTNKQTHTLSVDTNNDATHSPIGETREIDHIQEHDDIDQFSNITVMKLLPSMLQHFCRGGHVCFENVNTSGPRVPEGSQSCCTDCSCSPNCSQTGPCCFQEQLQESNTECIPEVYPPNDRYNAYKMVTSERNYENNTSLIETCGEKVVAPWGSMFPVFSKSHKSIYKNKYCADAYGVTDGVTWNIFVSCPTSYYYELMPYYWRYSILPYDCMVYFEHPGNVRDIEDMICLIKEVSKHSWCRNKNTPKPTGVPFSRDEILTACYSGLVSPYTIRELMFANIFCAMCRDRAALMPDRVCSVRSDITQRTGNRLMYLLDASVLPDVSLATNTMSSQKLACVADKCRPLLCSSGKILTTAGKCELVAKEWYNYDYLVPLQLTTTQMMNITEVFPKLSGTRSIANLQSPWSKRWNIFRVFYEHSPTGDLHMTDTIIVILHQSIRRVLSKDILQNIKRFKNKPWVIEIQNTKYFLEADFVRNRRLTENGRTRTLSLQTGGVNMSTILPKSSMVFEDRSFHLNKQMLINEKFYCDQVELLPTEFEIVNDDIYNKLTGKFILFHYFTLLPQSSTKSAIVCLEYSGMILSNSMAESYSILNHCTYALVLWVIIRCF